MVASCKRHRPSHTIKQEANAEPPASAMKEFELQGDISTGFSWHAKAADGQEGTVVKPEPFVPLGDTVRRKTRKKPSRAPILSTRDDDNGAVPIQHAERTPFPSGAEIAFNHQYVPLLASERRARRGLIQQWVNTHDPFVAAALSKQQDQEIPFLEELTATVGKKNANWRVVLQWEARHDQHARAELAHWLVKAATGDDPQESKRFHEAETALRRTLANGPFEQAKAFAIFWVLRYLCEKHCWPTRSMVKAALKERGHRFPSSKRGQNDARFFRGPVLGRVLKDKGGRPRG